MYEAILRMIEDNVFPTRANAALGAFANLIDELSEAVRKLPLNDAIKFIEERTGYRKMLEMENTPESDARLGNLDELANAAAEAVERAETVTEFLDHAALVAQADSIDGDAQVTLLTLHNAKGLEFPIVFLAGLEDGLFPHSRSLLSEAAMEEERRLCYVGMTRAEKRLYLTWAKYRRRFGGGEQERSIPSRFLREVPSELLMNLSPDDDEDIPQIDLTSERYEVRAGARKNLFTGKTYNSLQNINQFFQERGMTPPAKVSPNRPAPPPPPAKQAPPVAKPQSAQTSLFPADTPPWETPPARVQTPPQKRPQPAIRPAAPPSAMLPRPPLATRPLPAALPRPKGPPRTGTVVEHPKYGTGTILRREGDGDDAKLTIHFQRFGLKKLVEKYAGLKKDS
jgi:DNA helicase II / ATP-dependent DNA helicase PcrA